ncbi:MAG TPA: hypothetical protein VJ714_02115 [Anaerolineae bacterium]|jgi:hypothetical protein|nr:hypothetical protein [Anaerolineae bacterium]
MTRPTESCQDKVRKHVADHFPEMSEVKPKVKTTNKGGKTTHRFTFRKELRTPKGGDSQQIVHVTTDEEGRVLKVSVSR